MKSFREFVSRTAKKVPKENERQHLEEARKVIKTGHEQIGIDKPHHKGQQVHAHLPNGRAVNKDGSISHGGDPFIIKKSWADALRGHDFFIDKSRLVESSDDRVTIKVNAELLEFLFELQTFLRKHDG